jgi:GAF domain-containing protein
VVDRRGSPELDALAREALATGDMRSAALFVPGDESGSLQLAAAAGIDGPALDGLVAAVQNPAHPVARALTDAAPTFDVLPMNPGGPTLRSHLPLRASGQAADDPTADIATAAANTAAANSAAANTAAAERGRTLGVLALAHEAPTTEEDRAALSELADRAARLLLRNAG